MCIVVFDMHAGKLVIKYGYNKTCVWFVVYDEIPTPSVGLSCAIGVTTAVPSDITHIGLMCMPCAIERLPHCL
jgi:hypothetical protein